MIKINKINLHLLCLIYFLVIIWFLFFFNGEQNRLVYFSERHFSIIPFKTTLEYIFQIIDEPNFLTYKIDLIRDVGGNLFLLFPWGILGPTLFKDLDTAYKLAFSAFLISLLAEVIQFLFNIGVFDIDDLIFNISGAILGYVFLKFLRSLNKG